MQHVLVTGAAGFIGYHFCRYLLEQGLSVVGVDNLNSYYSPQLKRDRLKQLEPYGSFTFQPMELADGAAVRQLFAEHQFERVVHLAAQAGVRYSLENPQAYIDSNLVATGHLLEACRHQQTPHLVYASSSSVYGGNTRQPFSVHDPVDHPLSLYAATKKANELMAHTYSHLYGLPTTGLRFFTVYGPWGRPDMAAYKFTRAIFNREAIDVYNHGAMQRDFTYVDDIVEAMRRVMDQPAQPNPDYSAATPDPATSSAPFRVYNIGNHQPVELSRFIEILEQLIGLPAEKRLLPLQPGDVLATYADVDDLRAAVDFAPSTPLEVGLARFVDWYRAYHLTV
jgi:UDP-glucuronate 4-epimerase